MHRSLLTVHDITKCQHIFRFTIQKWHSKQIGGIFHDMLNFIQVYKNIAAQVDYKLHDNVYKRASKYMTSACRMF